MFDYVCHGFRGDRVLSDLAILQPFHRHPAALDRCGNYDCVKHQQLSKWDDYQLNPYQQGPPNRGSAGITRPSVNRSRLGKNNHIDETQSVKCNCREHQTMFHLLCYRLLDGPCKLEKILPPSCTGQRHAPEKANTSREGHNKKNGTESLPIFL